VLTNAHGQVMHQRRRPIPGLYATGYLAAPTESGIGYQAGILIASSMTFGYLAVRHMLALP
jgi:3-oxosteroid 1-dehydrogenase